jgi:hypothetical protein
MVKTIINISKKTSEIVNIVKTKYNLRNDSQAIEIITEEFNKYFLEPKNVKIEYKEKLNKILNDKHISSEDLNGVL